MYKTNYTCLSLTGARNNCLQVKYNTYIYIIHRFKRGFTPWKRQGGGGKDIFSQNRFPCENLLLKITFFHTIRGLPPTQGTQAPRFSQAFRQLLEEGIR